MEMELFQEAVREQIRLRAAIDGPTGSGKTFTALQWARIIAGPEGRIGFIDSESESAKRYAPTDRQRAGLDPVERINYWDPPYDFGWRAAEPPYDPRDLGKLIEAAGASLGGDGVLIIDSLTHYWFGEGGTLDIVDDAGRGNSYAGWKEGTPAQRFMLDKMLRCRCHLIVCMRSKMEYVLEDQENRRGQSVKVPVRRGMAPEQRSGIEYEFDVVASMSLPDHTLTVTKSRINEVADRTAHKGRSHEIALDLKEWLQTGARKVTDAQAEELMEMFKPVDDVARRAAVKKAFAAEFGVAHPSDLRADRLDEAKAWLADATRPASVEAAKPVTPADLPDDALEGMAAAALEDGS
jgi:hypothetical protein